MPRIRCPFPGPSVTPHEAASELRPLCEGGFMSPEEIARRRGICVPGMEHILGRGPRPFCNAFGTCAGGRP